MNFTRRRKFRQFFAALTILSFTFTQAVPAWALRPEGGGSPTTQAGLEERLLGDVGKGTPLSGLVARLAADPIWRDPSPGWNPSAPLENEQEALFRIQALFEVYRAELSDSALWDLVIGELLAPGDRHILEMLQ